MGLERTGVRESVEVALRRRPDGGRRTSTSIVECCSFGPGTREGVTPDVRMTASDGSSRPSQRAPSRLRDVATSMRQPSPAANVGDGRFVEVDGDASDLGYATTARRTASRPASRAGASSPSVSASEFAAGSEQTSVEAEDRISVSAERLGIVAFGLRRHRKRRSVPASHTAASPPTARAPASRRARPGRRERTREPPRRAGRAPHRRRDRASRASVRSTTAAARARDSDSEKRERWRG